MNKKSLYRTAYLRRRKLLSSNELNRRNLLIQSYLIELGNIWTKSRVHIFLPIKNNNEVDTWPIIDFVETNNGVPIVSHSNLANNSMIHYIYDPEMPIEENKWGIPEPLAGRQIEANLIDIVFIPLLAFDNHGNRVGYGKGYYDRFLSECRSDCKKIGLSFSPPMNKIYGMEPSDVKMDYCISPQGLHNFENHNSVDG